MGHYFGLHRDRVAVLGVIALFVFVAAVAVLAEREGEETRSSTGGEIDEDASSTAAQRGRQPTVSMQEESDAFNERVSGWKYMRDQGELSTERGQGFGEVYKDVHQWRWRRTISFWIAITFFTGSLFFTISSFLGCYPAALGEMKWPLTTGGFLAGKMNFIVCCYMMCIECVNMGEETGEDDGTFYYNPFAASTAIANLRKLGCGPWPYWASVNYFIGCLVFTVGFGAELIGESKFEEKGTTGNEICAIMLRWAFMIGSILFLIGGCMECVENKVFRCNLRSKGAIGALLNTLGGVGFCLGSALAWVPGTGYWQSFHFGWGSALFVIGSSIMIIMWKDEQYGLTFLAVLNGHGGENGQPMIGREGKPPREKAAFSSVTVLFIHMYCLTMCLATYNTNIELHQFLVHRTAHWRHLQWAFEEWTPCFLAMAMLALRSALAKTPKGSPYAQIFGAVRVLMVMAMFNTALTFSQFLHANITG